MPPFFIENVDERRIRHVTVPSHKGTNSHHWPALLVSDNGILTY
jgi:hypothetical protein